MMNFGFKKVFIQADDSLWLLCFIALSSLGACRSLGSDGLNGANSSERGESQNDKMKGRVGLAEPRRLTAEVFNPLT